MLRRHDTLLMLSFYYADIDTPTLMMMLIR